VNISRKILVCYLFTKFDSIEDFKNFIKNYNSFKIGQEHSLMICCKLLDEVKKNSIINVLKDSNIKFELFYDPSLNNDFDFGSYYRVAQIHSNSLIFYLNASSKPITNNWLRILTNEYEENSLLGTTASFESHSSNIKLKKNYKIFSFIYKRLMNLIFFKPFPNPHIRTTGFLLYAKDFIDFYNNKKCQNKHDAWKLESGRDSLTNFFLKKKFPVKLINSDGNSFKIDNWINSNTYCYLEKSKLIISDKHTRKYEVLNNSEKKLYQKNVWGV
tara:strand:- start:2000 stop:2815 length:816 start_codon:yes stop_codon:yes gene_type:complete